MPRRGSFPGKKRFGFTFLATTTLAAEGLRGRDLAQRAPRDTGSPKIQVSRPHSRPVSRKVGFFFLTEEEAAWGDSLWKILSGGWGFFWTPLGGPGINQLGAP